MNTNSNSVKSHNCFLKMDPDIHDINSIAKNYSAKN